ncbi:L-ascorbate metabolism protein UlaG (beta-lactamase superfamily) [Tumebacillus sp. BK434]|uniref:MBL fold metallo-hydrolase n=1 Tax=Tumebacillus sp. BK434 TaxID=2512169 RepID=UPI00104E1A0C|nr:MBL fold metallo-hydrolase [Tumebacillus sp. BK434]TCP52615.1 L-ascorbate metabolism protein UlaG (beta-lactamase superfamily) [Tumebacillus sp. BK434]
MILTLSILLALVLAVFLVLTFYPHLGGKLSTEQKERHARSKQFRQGKFVNQTPTRMDSSLKTSLGILREFMKGNPRRKPSTQLPMEPLRLQEGGEAHVTWFGHSALLIELDGKKLLLDPMFGRTPSPFPQVGGRRYSGELPFEIEELPEIDAVILSHDHYDHLDYGSIKRLHHKVGQFIVPLGVGAHLKRWGVAPEKIQEHDWWSEFEYAGLTLACTPARHFSGRSLTDRDKTLWCSWVIIGRQAKLYFSGDGGYGPHFQEIGRAYGPFDLTMMECGQYDPRWAAIHMMPEETVQAHLDVQGRVLLPIHWAAFTLALHDWTDPVERALQAAQHNRVTVATPRIGEKVPVQAAEYPASTWWR